MDIISGTVTFIIKFSLIVYQSMEVYLHDQS